MLKYFGAQLKLENYALQCQNGMPNENLPRNRDPSYPRVVSGIRQADKHVCHFDSDDELKQSYVLL